MKKLQWDMKEVFYFPESVGVPNDARLVKVKAGFTEKRSDDAVRLSGIYHIVAKVDFADGQRNETIPNDVVFVDDVELEGETGYFEYAVPLYIDLPPEVEHPLHIEATDVKSTFDGQGSFTVAWNVNCTYGQASAVETANNEAESKAVAKKEIAKKETASKEVVSEATAKNEAADKEVVIEGTANKVAASKEVVSKATANKETTHNEVANKEVVDQKTASKEAFNKVAANNETAEKEPASQTAEAKKEPEVAEEKVETAAVQEVKETVVAVSHEPAQKAQASEKGQYSAPQKQVAAKAEPVQESQATAMHDSSSWNSQDDILSYIAALPDEWSTSQFRSNEIFVKEES